MSLWFFAVPTYRSCYPEAADKFPAGTFAILPTHPAGTPVAGFDICAIWPSVSQQQLLLESLALQGFPSIPCIPNVMHQFQEVTE
jgi:hypothetical protein